VARSQTRSSNDQSDNIVQQTDEDQQTDQDQEADRIMQELLQQSNWSQKIRYLASEGFKNSTIAHILSELRGYEMRPQHVNNVLTKPLKRPAQQNQRSDEIGDKVVSLLPRPKE
jgi:hypothetical protein